jgi:hypothetical protein
MNSNNIPRAVIQTNDSVTVAYPDNKVFTVSLGQAHFQTVKKALLAKAYDSLRELFTPAKAIAENFRLRSGDVSVTDAGVFRNGVMVHNHVCDRILDFLRDGLDFQPLVNFMVKLDANPSRRAIEELYRFLEHKKMPLTPSGNFLAYKAVQGDFYSITAGQADKVLRGVVDSFGRILNSVGAEVEVSRNYVDDDRARGCSSGLHAGSLEYATGFMPSDGRLLIVEINPADVVSVPDDCDCQKLRTSKYKVVGEYARPLTEALNEDYYVSDADDEWGRKPDGSRYHNKRDENGRFVSAVS